MSESTPLNVVDRSAPERTDQATPLTQEEKMLGKTLKKSIHLSPEDLAAVNSKKGLMQLLNLESPPVQVSQTLTAILLAHIFYNTTIVIRLVGDFWTHLDPRLNQAARSLGAKPWQAWMRVTLPLLAPALLAATLLVVIFDFTSFGVILILGGPKFATIEVEIFYQAIKWIFLIIKSFNGCFFYTFQNFYKTFVCFNVIS